MLAYNEPKFNELSEEHAMQASQSDLNREQKLAKCLATLEKLLENFQSDFDSMYQLSLALETLILISQINEEDKAAYHDDFEQYYAQYQLARLIQQYDILKIYENFLSENRTIPPLGRMSMSEEIKEVSQTLKKTSINQLYKSAADHNIAPAILKTCLATLHDKGSNTICIKTSSKDEISIENLKLIYIIAKNSNDSKIKELAFTTLKMNFIQVPQVHFWLAECYAHGWGIQPNQESALTRYLQAGRAGYLPGLRGLAKFTYTQDNFVLAQYWQLCNDPSIFEQLDIAVLEEIAARNKGSLLQLITLVMLGIIHYKITRNFTSAEEAIKCFKAVIKLSKNMNPFDNNSSVQLIRHSSNLPSIKKLQSVALQYLKEINKKQNSLEAALILSTYYEQGWGGTSNKRKACQYLLKAVLNHHTTMNQIEYAKHCMHLGELIDDPYHAARYYFKAATLFSKSSFPEFSTNLIGLANACIKNLCDRLAADRPAQYIYLEYANAMLEEQEKFITQFADLDKLFALIHAEIYRSDIQTGSRDDVKQLQAILNNPDLSDEEKWIEMRIYARTQIIGWEIYPNKLLSFFNSFSSAKKEKDQNIETLLKHLSKDKKEKILAMNEPRELSVGAANSIN